MAPTLRSQVYLCVENHEQNLIRLNLTILFETPREEIKLHEILDIIIERHRNSAICVIIIVCAIKVIFRYCKVASL